MKALCVIPARGGSKRLKNKNLLPLAGKPLVAYSIEVAQEAGIFDDIVLSTDSEEIADVAREYGIETYDRPAEYASDQIGVIPALLELMETFSEQDRAYDVVCQTLPTSLFKRAEHFVEAYNMLDSETDSVVAVSPYEFPLSKALQKKGDLIKPYWPNSPLLTGTARTQDQEVFYHDNGAFYFAWWESLLQKRNFYIGNAKGYEVHPLNAVDIDDEIDFLQAQLLIAHAKRHPGTELSKVMALN